MKYSKEYFMKEALKEAKKAMMKDEVPIGAVIVKDNKIVARAHNLRETKKSSIAHSEILAIDKACKKLENWRLNNCDIYVTVEPCPMCAGAILNSRIRKVYYGTIDEKSGAITSNSNLFDMNNTFCNHKVEYEKNVLEGDCKALLKDFFTKLRKKSNSN